MQYTNELEKIKATVTLLFVELYLQDWLKYLVITIKRHMVHAWLKRSTDLNYPQTRPDQGSASLYVNQCTNVLVYPQPKDTADT